MILQNRQSIVNAFLQRTEFRAMIINAVRAGLELETGPGTHPDCLSPGDSDQDEVTLGATGSLARVSSSGINESTAI